MPSLSFYPLVLLSAIVITACDQPDDDDIQYPLVGTMWVLTSIDTGISDSIYPPSGKSYFVVFQPNDTLAAQVDCNSCVATFLSGGDGSLSISILGCTLFSCLEGGLEYDFEGALMGATFWSIQGDQLSIQYSYGDAEGGLKFEAGDVE